MLEILLNKIILSSYVYYMHNKSIVHIDPERNLCIAIHLTEFDLF